MQKYKKIILERNAIPVAGILILLITNCILGMTLVDYSTNIYLLGIIIFSSFGVLMYLTSLLYLDDDIKYKTFAIMALLNFVTFTYFMYNGFLGSDVALKMAYSILIYMTLIYRSINSMYESIGSKVVISIVFLSVNMFLISLIIMSLSVAGLGV